LYSEAEQGLANSVALTFEQCGGRYAHEKPLAADFNTRTSDVQALLAESTSSNEWLMSGCGSGDFVCLSNYKDGKSSQTFEDAFKSHDHDNSYVFRETYNTTDSSE